MEIIHIIHFFIEIVLAGSLFVVASKALRKQKDDPRLSSGLQLLQSKIAVLEDLSDRTESQVSQLIKLLEAKGKDVQKKISKAEQQIELIKQSMEKSLEVAEIFQDKIPHEEIIERQKTYNYMKAARMAYQGHDISEIARVVNIPFGELEILVKMNREQLLVDENQMPEWAKMRMQKEQEQERERSEESVEESRYNSNQFEGAFEVPQYDNQSLEALGENFRKACQDFAQETVPEQAPISERVKELAGDITESLGQFLQHPDQKVLSRPSFFEESREDDASTVGVASNREQSRVSKVELNSNQVDEFDLDALKKSATESLLGSKSIKMPAESTSKVRDESVKASSAKPLVRKVEFPRI